MPASRLEVRGNAFAADPRIAAMGTILPCSSERGKISRMKGGMNLVHSGDGLQGMLD
jgi:hypothetical protein